MADRAVSETLGFVLIFSMIALTVTTIVVFGFSALDETRQNEQIRNAERGLDILAHNQEDIVVRGAPSRGTELKLGGGTLEASGTTRVTVTVDGGTPKEVELTPLTYRYEDSEIVYEAGAVIRSFRDNGRVQREPNWALGLAGDGEKTIIHVVNTTRVTGPTSIGGSGARLVRSLDHKTVIQEEVRSGSPAVKIEVKTEESRVGAWERWLEGETDEDCTVSGDTVTCQEYTTEAVLLMEHQIFVTFE